MDKSVLTIVSLEDDSNDVAFWLEKSPHERLAALELLRSIHYGYDPATARLQRLLEIAPLGGMCTCDH
jgi:hypothetical protein